MQYPDGADAHHHPLEDFLIRFGIGGSVESASGLLHAGATGGRWTVRLRNPHGRTIECCIQLPTAHRIWLEGADVALRQAGYTGAKPGREFLPILMDRRMLGLALRWSAPAPPDLAEALEVLAADTLCIAAYPDFHRWCNEQGHDASAPRSRAAYEDCRRAAVSLYDLLGDEALDSLLEWVRQTN